MNETTNITKQFLDKDGLNALWTKICDNFASKDDLNNLTFGDTKNTTGATNTNSKIYLVGAISQSTNPVTYSHDTAYIGSDGYLYSNSTKVDMSKLDDKADTNLTSTLILQGTDIPSNADLNTTEYLKIGVYTCKTYATGITLKNCPVSNGFRMEVYSYQSSNTDDSILTTAKYVYRLRKIIRLSGEQYYQYVYATTEPGVFTYDDWYYVPTTKATIDTTDTNGSTVTTGGTSTPVYINSSGKFASCTGVYNDSQSCIPKSSLAYDLGSSTKQFSTTYTRYIDTASGYNLRLKSEGTEHMNMFSGNVNTTANIIPTANNTYNLGSTDYKWKNVYATTFTGNLKGVMLSGVSNSSSGSDITEIPKAIRFDSVLEANSTTGFGSGYNNAILTIGRYSTTKYASQLGFSGNGKLYYRSFNNATLDDSKAWNQIAFTSDIPTIPTSLKNPYSLTIQANGTTLTNGVYDGSAAKTVNITAASIGAASVDDIPTIPESLKNPNSLTIQANGTTVGTYDGSLAVTANITTESLGLSKVFDYKGVTTTALSDGSTTKPIIINGERYTQKIGDVVIVNGDTDKEYFWNGTKWEELGRTIDLSGYAPLSHVHTKSEITDFPTSLKNPYSLTIQGNGITLTNGVYNGSASKTVNITAASIGAASADDIEGSLYKTIYASEKETSNPGILVKTSVGATSNAMISVKITGNAYCANGSTKPILTVLEFYNYYNGGNSNPRIINISGTHFGVNLGTIKLFNYDSKVCLLIPQTGNYQSFNVFANWTNSSGVDNNVNVVESLTKSNVPSTATYLVDFTPNIIAYDGDATSSNGGHTHTINATSSTTEVAAKTHNHTVTATGSVSSSFTGTQTTTGNNTSGATVASSGHTHTTSNDGSHTHTI